jgi:hypothetical protein
MDDLGPTEIQHVRESFQRAIATASAPHA